MSHHLDVIGVFVVAFLALVMWAGHPSQPAAAGGVRVAGYPYASAVCEFGAAGGRDCVNPRNAHDMYDWGYWKSRTFGPSDQWGYEYRNCTSYVAWRLARAGVPPAWFTNLGDGSQWIANVRGERGVVVNKHPSPGAVAAWDFAGVGHVAWVVSVRGPRVTVADYNSAGTGGYDQHIIGSSPTGYIHFSRLSVTGLTVFG